MARAPAPMNTTNCQRSARTLRLTCNLLVACLAMAGRIDAQSTRGDPPAADPHAHHQHEVTPQADPRTPITLRAERTGGDIVLDLGPISLPANAGHDGIQQPPPL